MYCAETLCIDFAFETEFKNVYTLSWTAIITELTKESDWNFSVSESDWLGFVLKDQC